MAKEKSLLSSESFSEEKPAEDKPAEEVVAHDANAEHCDCCSKGYGSCDYDKTGKCAKDMEKSADIEVSEKDKSFSEEVKDVLAALHDLMTRTNAIAMLRAKDGRKLGVKATEALRAVQDDLQDAWVEIDQFIDTVGTEGALELEDLDEEQAEIEDVVEEPTDSVDTEEVAVEPEEEVENPAESEEVEEVTEVPVDNTESVDEEDLEDEVWAESQRLMAEAVDVEITDDEV
jgi:hypothetical protein